MKEQGAFSIEYLNNAETMFKAMEDCGLFVNFNIKKKIEEYNELERKYNSEDFSIIGKKQYSKDFSNIMLTSWLLSIYALAEAVLTWVCDAHAKGAKIPSKDRINHTSKLGRIIEVQNYLKKQDSKYFSDPQHGYASNYFESNMYSSISESEYEYSKIFDSLDTARLIRNKFAHAGGKGKLSGNLKEVIEKCKDVKESSDHQIILSEKYCYGLLEKIRNLLNGIRLWVYTLIF